MKTLIAMIIITSLAYSQTVYEIPFASKGNSIELTVANNSERDLTNVEISLEGAPEWVEVGTPVKILKYLKGNEEGIAAFEFSIDKKAPVNKSTNLKFHITAPSGDVWSKEIAIKVLPPDKYELYQNYPNPFNPSTTISYQLPKESQVILKIYNILGKEVETLKSEMQESGYYEIVWNANNYSSGMYIYQLIAKLQNGESKIQQKKMLMIK